MAMRGRQWRVWKRSASISSMPGSARSVRSSTRRRRISPAARRLRRGRWPASLRHGGALNALNARRLSPRARAASKNREASDDAQPSLRRHRFSAAAGLDNSRVLAADARQRRNRVLRLYQDSRPAPLRIPSRLDLSFRNGCMWWQQTLWKSPRYYPNHPNRPFGESGLAYWMGVMANRPRSRHRWISSMTSCCRTFAGFTLIVYSRKVLTAVSLILAIFVLQRYRRIATSLSVARPLQFGGASGR